MQDTAHHLPDDPRLRRAFLTPLLLEDLNKVTAGESSLDPADWAAHTDTHGFDSQEVRGRWVGGVLPSPRRSRLLWLVYGAIGLGVFGRMREGAAVPAEACRLKLLWPADEGVVCVVICGTWYLVIP